jgi:hypothetical protein
VPASRITIQHRLERGCQSLETPVERHAHRPLAHPQLYRNFARGVTFERDSPNDIALTRIQLLERLLHIVCLLFGVRFLNAQSLENALDRHLDATTLASPGIDDLVPCDRGNPGPHGSTGHPGASLQVQG